MGDKTTGYRAISDSRKGPDMEETTNDTQPVKRHLRAAPTSTVGRGKAVVLNTAPEANLYQEPAR